MGRPRREVECPNCGAIFREGRLACPECGSDANTGWKDPDEIAYQSVEIPDYLDEDALRPRREPFTWWIVIVISVAAFALLAVLR